MESSCAKIRPMVIVAGTACLDRIHRIKSMPPLGGYADVIQTLEFAGGEAVNTAVGLAGLGTKVHLMASALGADPAGRRIRGSLRGAANLTWAANVHRASTPICDIYVDERGERTMFGHGFLELANEGLPALPEEPEGTWFTIDPNLGDLARQLYCEARARKFRLYAQDFILPDDPLKPGDWWQSSTDWVGVRGDLEKSKPWLEAFVQKTGVNAILTDGANGLLFASPDHPPEHFESTVKPEVVDTTGAGDLFRAGMLHGLENDWAIPRCLEFASACGAYACLSYGGGS